MKIYMPFLTQYARHGGVTQFVSNFSTIIKNDDDQLYDHMGEIRERFGGSTFSRRRTFLRKVILFKYVLLFPFKLKKADHIFLNPSLGKASMLREMYYAKCCEYHNKPYSIFFHGWNWAFAEFLDTNNTLRLKYVKLINSADNVFVLGQKFKDKLIHWGVAGNKIILEKTTVNDDFLPNLSKKNFSVKKLNILFLSRVIRSKGIFEAVDAFALHVKDFPKSTFNIAGAGKDLQRLQIYVKDNNIPNINFLGFADENMKKQLMANNDIFILPSYSEGMPISIFEAMAYGLTIITRPVGGIPDYFSDQKMGFLIESLEPKLYATALNFAADNLSVRKQVANFNFDFVKNNVIASVVNQRILTKIKCINDK